MDMRSKRSFLMAAAVSTAALTLAGCNSSGSYRVASIGSQPPGDTAGADTPGGGNGGTDVADNGGGNGTQSGGGNGGGNGATPGDGNAPGTGTAPGQRPVGGKLLVAAGNIVHTAGAKHSVLASTVNGIAPAAAPMTGKVSAVIDRTGQTLVDVGNGNSVLLNGVGGKLGEVVQIDLGRGRVTRAQAGSPLLGVGVLSPTTPAGELATVGVASGGRTATLDVAPVKAIVQGVTGTPVAGPVQSIVGAPAGTPVVAPVVAPVTGIVQGVGNKVGGLTGLGKRP